MSSFDTQSLQQALAAGEIDKILNDDLARIFQAAVKLFAQRFQASEIDTPFANVTNVTATEVAITCTAMLEAVNIQLFELGLWQSWQGAA
ncbi:MAG: hypothetical protein P4L54_10595 [Acidocella sp.]|nr:hypothetical protein [Acidocella sp.]